MDIEYWELSPGHWVISSSPFVHGSGYLALSTEDWVVGTGNWAYGSGHWVLDWRLVCIIFFLKDVFAICGMP